MKPYYDDGRGFVIYNCDCREIVPTLGNFDLLLTDPPYGIGADNRNRILSRQNLAAAKDYGESDWDNDPPSTATITRCRLNCKSQIIWGGNYFELPPSRCWLFWDKLNGANDFADGELAWTNLDMAVRRKCHLWNGMIRKGQEVRFHPTQKPLEIMTWCISLVDGAQTILDPFGGSGSTDRAAKDLGRKCTMIEKEERYAEIAARRMEQEVFAL